MHIKEIESVLTLPKDELYKTFLLRICDNELIWVLDDNGILCYGDNDGNCYFPIWPEKEFSELCATDDWEKAKPLQIQLDDFLENYIPNLIQNNTLISVFPRTNSTENIILSPIELAKSIVSYLQEWYGDELELDYLL